MLKLFLANVKMQFRNKQLLFWNLVFPLLFTVIFGFFFSGGSMNAGTIAFVSESDSTLAKSIETDFSKYELIKFRKEESLDTSKDLLKRSTVAAIVYIPVGFGSESTDAPKNITVYADPSNAQANATVTGFLSMYLTQANYTIQNAQPIFGITQEKTSTNNFTYFDFVMVGLIGMSLMNSAIQGLAVSMAKYRDDKILKRITTTPLPAWVFITSELLSRLIINFIQVSLIIGVSVLFFKGHIYGSIGMLYLIALLGAILFQLFGFAVAAISKSTDAAEGMATAITVPMMFLSGVFFPIDTLPKWLFSVVQFLPLAPLLRMMRGVALENVSPLFTPLNLILVGGWIVVMLLFTIKRFKLSEE